MSATGLHLLVVMTASYWAFVASIVWMLILAGVFAYVVLA
jgi:hypothetical protein